MSMPTVSRASEPFAGLRPGHRVEVFFDGACPLCVREMKLLRRWDRKSLILFTDISRPDFDAQRVGLDYGTLMSRLHGRLPNGQIIEGVEVFRRLYAAVGFGPIVALSRLPGIREILDWSYAWFAKNRLRLTGRCHDGSCRLPVHSK